MQVDVLILICTFNRAESLRRTLDSLSRLIVPTETTAELVIVDNNSSDHTSEVCKAARIPIPVRYLFEPMQGHNFALNRGLAETSAPLVLFTDDDVDVDEHWLTSYWDLAARKPEAGYFGGRTLPRWEVTPPRWFAENSSTHLACVEVYVDLGQKEQPLETGVVGANMAIRRKALDGLAFDPALGPDGTETVRCGEVDLISRMRRRGVIGYYTPAAVIYHRTPPRRMTEAYVRQWFKGDGIAEVRRNQIVREKPLLGAPRYYWKQLFVNGLKYALTRPVASASIWLPAEIAMAKSWGVISECRRHRSLLTESFS